MINGLLLVDKPAGISSFGVVAKVRGCLRAHYGVKNIKVGHTGTLDPAATGLLVLAIGNYTKRVPELIKQDKTYEVTIKLGETSTTGDKEGEITVISGDVPTKEEIETILKKFTGELMQTPPAFSAIKVNGQRAYNLARKGKQVNLAQRQITIYDTKFTDYKYPYAKFTTSVSSGTYIRSLVEDIGKTLGVGAYMSDLRRTDIARFSVGSAIKLDNIDYSMICNNLITLEN